MDVKSRYIFGEKEKKGIASLKWQCMTSFPYRCLCIVFVCCNACRKMALGEGDWGEGTVLSTNIWSASDISKYMLHTNIFFIFSPNIGTVPKAIVAKRLWEGSGLSCVFRYQLELKRIGLYRSIVNSQTSICFECILYRYVNMGILPLPIQCYTACQINWCFTHI